MPRILLALLLLLAACGESPAEPRRVSVLRLFCDTAGVNVQCRASTQDFRGAPIADVTDEVTWVVSNPGVATITRGVLVPLSTGAVTISARTADGIETDLPPSFMVGPAQPARWLYWVSGVVTDADTGARLPDVVVRMVDGYAAGQVVLTNPNGAYRIQPILTGETFTIEVRRTGYEPAFATYRVDPPVGPAGGNPPWLDVRLKRAP